MTGDDCARARPSGAVAVSGVVVERIAALVASAALVRRRRWHGVESRLDGHGGAHGGSGPAFARSAQLSP